MSITSWLRQRKYTKEHRASEHGDGFRLMALDYDILPTYMGRRPWCDTVLQDCPVPSHNLCCLCTHLEQNPYEKER